MTKKQSKILLFFFLFCLIGAGVFYFFTQDKSWASEPLSLDQVMSPQILSASVEPEKVRLGDIMTIRTEIKDPFGIKEVKADMGGIETIKLELIEGDIYQGTWKNNWLVYNTIQKEYITTIIATNIFNETEIKEIKWSDPSYLVKEAKGSGSILYGAQRKCARASNGDLYCIIEKDNQIYLSESTDGGQTWTEEKVHADTAAAQYYPSIAIDSSDNVHVVWQGYGWGTNTGYLNIQYRKRTDSWQTQEGVTDVANDQYRPSIAIDSSDNVHVVWNGMGWGTSTSNYNIQYRKRTDSWQTQEGVTDVAQHQYGSSIAIDSSDNVHVVWYGYGWGTNTGYNNIQYRKRTDSWQTQEGVTDVAQHQYRSSITIDSSDNVHVVWQGYGWGTNTGYLNIQYRKRTDSWQTQEGVTDVNIGQYYPSIAIDSSDNVHVVWIARGRGTNTGNYNIQYRKRTDSWQTQEGVTDVAGDQRYPNLLWARWPVIDGNKTNILNGYALIWLASGSNIFKGNATEVSSGTFLISSEIYRAYNFQRRCARASNGDLYCIYSRGDNTLTYQVYLVKSTDGGQTWTEEKVHADIAASQSDPSIAIDSSDNVHVVWQGYGWGTNTGYLNIQYRKRTDSWQTQEGVTDVASGQSRPSIAIDSSDNVHVVWNGFGWGTNAGFKNIQYRKRTDSWQTQEGVTDVAGDQHWPSIAIDSSDNVHVVWSSWADIQYRKRTDSWQTQEGVTDPYKGQWQEIPSITIDSSDNVHVVWYGKGWGTSTGNYNIQYRKRTDSWQTQEGVTDVAYDQYYPSIAIDSSDNVHVVWYGKGWGTNTGYNNVQYRKRTDSWQTQEGVTDVVTSQQYPNLLWALHPTVSGGKTNRPKAGYAFIWRSIDEGAKFYKSSDLGWENLLPTVTSVSHSPDPQGGGSDVSFTSEAFDLDPGDTIKLYVCKDASCTNCQPGTTTNCWAVTATGTATNPSAFYTCPSCTVATNNYYARVCDNNDDCSSTTSVQTFTCKKENGCSEETASNCFSNYAVDGYCCDTACTGGCERCDATPGTCTLRAADDNVECPLGYRCNGLNPTCQPPGAVLILPPFSATGQGNIDQNLGGGVSCPLESGKIAKVAFPSYSIKGTVVVKIEPQDKTEVIKTKTLPQNKKIIGDLVADFKALSGGKELESFDKKATITFTYSDSQVKEAGVDEEVLKIYFWDKTTSSWKVLKSEVNTITNTVTADTLHFTLFALIGETVIEEEKPIIEMSIEELKAKIARITALITKLQAQLAELLAKVVIEGVPAGFTFEQNLRYGQVSNDVKYLQIVLNSDPETRLAEEGVGSPGNETNYFGPLTKAAVIKFQEKYASDVLAPWDLTSGTGLVGSTTRAKINEILGR